MNSPRRWKHFSRKTTQKANGFEAPLERYTGVSVKGFRGQFIFQISAFRTPAKLTQIR